jgi:hypothetical protein
LKRLLAIGVATACVLFAGGANAALVKVGNLVLTADGGFTPLKLPRQTFVPIDFTGHADLRAADGSVPPPLQQVMLNFDRDGRLSTTGLPICQPSLLEDATPAEARSRCPNAIVGTGHISALIALGTAAPILASSPITLFNGPRQEGHPTVILHARTTVPATQTFVVTIPIEKRGGLYRYRATVDVPPIAGGHGSLVHLDVKVGKRYRYRGSERSYTEARCGDGIFRTRGRFTFADSTIIEGSVEKACTVSR